MEKLIVLGGGITGLNIARLLAGCARVTVLEKSNSLGGLVSVFKLKNTPLERYYHHFFRGDKELISVLEQLGLTNRIVWNFVKMGFLVDGTIYDFTGPLDLLSFTPIGFIDRLRFGFMILGVKLSNNWDDLDDRRIKDWVYNSVGKDVFDRLIYPMLKSKFGDTEDISAAWLWGRFKSRSSSISLTNRGELLGYVDGSFHQLVNALATSVGKSRIHRNTQLRINILGDSVRSIIISHQGKFKEMKIDRLVSTIPLPELLDITDGMPKPMENKLRKIKYQAVVCTCLGLKKKLGRYYWVNIASNKYPFGAIIQHTSLVDPRAYGCEMVYLVNYVNKDSKLYKMSDNELVRRQLSALEAIYPEFEKDNLLWYKVFRDKYATPIYSRSFVKKMPKYVESVSNLHFAGTFSIYPDDRNINNSLRTGRECAEFIKNLY